MSAEEIVEAIWACWEKDLVEAVAEMLAAGTSLGEQPHDPEHCHRGGRPHLGPCIDGKDGER